MAKQTITLCDICGKKDASVVTLALSDNRLVSDLCAACQRRLVKEYHFAQTISTNRTRRIWDFDEIPRNTMP